MGAKAKLSADTPPRPPVTIPPTDVGQTPAFEVKALVGEGREAVILHNGDRYRLRITANDKLILTK